MTHTVANPYPNVSPPVGAVWAEEWRPDGQRHYRNFAGEERSIGEFIRVWAHGTQHDGRIDDGTRDPAFRAPGISVEGVDWEDAISSETARTSSWQR